MLREDQQLLLFLQKLKTQEEKAPEQALRRPQKLAALSEQEVNGGVSGPGEGRLRPEKFGPMGAQLSLLQHAGRSATSTPANIGQEKGKGSSLSLPNFARPQPSAPCITDG